MSYLIWLHSCSFQDSEWNVVSILASVRILQAPTVLKNESGLWALSDYIDSTSACLIKLAVNLVYLQHRACLTCALAPAFLPRTHEQPSTVMPRAITFTLQWRSSVICSSTHCQDKHKGPYWLLYTVISFVIVVRCPLRASSYYVISFVIYLSLLCNAHSQLAFWQSRQIFSCVLAYTCFLWGDICWLVYWFTCTQILYQSNWSFLFLPTLFWGCVQNFPVSNLWFVSVYFRSYGCFF